MRPVLFSLCISYVWTWKAYLLLECLMWWCYWEMFLLQLHWFSSIDYFCITDGDWLKCGASANLYTDKWWVQDSEGSSVGREQLYSWWCGWTSEFIEPHFFPNSVEKWWKCLRRELVLFFQQDLAYCCGCIWQKSSFFVILVVLLFDDFVVLSPSNLRVLSLVQGSAYLSSNLVPFSFNWGNWRKCA